MTRDAFPPGGSRRLRLRRFRPRFEPVEARLLLSTFTVTTTADAGAGSLRQAILDADASTTPATIDFAVGSGPQTITPASPLPPLSNTTAVDGTTQPGYAGLPLIEINGSQIFEPSTTPPAPMPDVPGLLVTAGGSAVRGLVINRFTGDGIVIQGGGRTTVAGDFLGTDRTGSNALPNGGDGLRLVDSRNNVIGGTAAADRNVISGNGGSGVEVTSSGRGFAGGNLIEGNLIGTDASGQFDVGNTFDGVSINANTGNVIGGATAGAGNVIAFNGGDGVLLGNFYYGTLVVSATILSNSIHDNTGQGIDLNFGAKDPVFGSQLTSAFRSGSGTVVEGTFFGAPNTTFALQFFSNPAPDPSGAGQGQTLVGAGTATTDSTGSAHFSITLGVAIDTGASLSATATDPSGSTSGFFVNTTVAPAASADLSVSQSADNLAPVTGQPFTYSVYLTNNGPSQATRVVLTDTLPAGVTVTKATSGNGTVSQSNGVVTVTYPTLFLGQNDLVQITVVPARAGVLTNDVSARADQPEPSGGNNTSSLDLTATPSPFPLVVKSVQPQVGLRSINAVVITFNLPLDPAQAVNPINYAILKANRHFQFKIPVTLNPPVYDPKAMTVTLTPTRPLALGTAYQLQINPQNSAGVTDVSGNLLVGNTSQDPNSPYYLAVFRGIAPPTPRPHHGGGQVHFVESVIARRVVSGPGSDVSGIVAALPPLNQATTLRNTRRTNPPS
jgi:uncharacterized repeat protein (TIGR01451 family)